MYKIKIISTIRGCDQREHNAFSAAGLSRREDTRPSREAVLVNSCKRGDIRKNTI